MLWEINQSDFINDETGTTANLVKWWQLLQVAFL